MDTQKKTGLPWEDAAELRTVIGWACKTCNRFHGEGAAGAQEARHCHASDAPCECGGRRHKQYSVCDDCRAKQDAERYCALEEVDWDGKTPLVDYDGDRYLFDVEDLMEFLDDCDFSLPCPVGAVGLESVSAEEYRDLGITCVRLCLCKEQPPMQFDIADLLNDHEVVAGAEIDAAGLAAEKAVNDWLALLGPAWAQTNKRPSLASLRRHLGLSAVESGEESD